jgi:hypothetical protein
MHDKFNHKGAERMKKRLLILMVILLNAALISLPVAAQPETSETMSAAVTTLDI